MNPTRYFVALLLVLGSNTSEAVSNVCHTPGASLPAEFANWWHKLGGDEGYLGCATGQPTSTADGQGREVPFKDGIVQIRPGAEPSQLVIAHRAERLLVFVDSMPVVRAVAVAIDTRTKEWHSSSLVTAGAPAYIDVPWSQAATYSVQLYSCSGPSLLSCTVPVGPAVQVEYSPYQIDLTMPSSGWSGSTAEDIFRDRGKRIQRFQACRGALGPINGENEAVTLLAKLSDPDGRCPFSTKTNLEEAAEAIFASSFNPWVGTTEDPVKIPLIGECSRPGEYDTALWALVRAAYQFPALLASIKNNDGITAYDHLVKKLLTPHGGAAQGSWTVVRDSCGIRVPETENHILLIESSRYLINELLGTGPLPRADYNNATNGLPNWLLHHLQLFILRDFYETNSIPYQRYSAYALLNLADLAPVPVKDGARIVLDYLAAKFSAQSNELRRLPSFRRRLEEPIIHPHEYFGEKGRCYRLANVPSRRNDRSRGRHV